MIIQVIVSSDPAPIRDCVVFIRLATISLSALTNEVEIDSPRRRRAAFMHRTLCIHVPPLADRDEASASGNLLLNQRAVMPALGDRENSPC